MWNKPNLVCVFYLMKRDSWLTVAANLGKDMTFDNSSLTYQQVMLRLQARPSPSSMYYQLLGDGYLC